METWLQATENRSMLAGVHTVNEHTPASEMDWQPKWMDAVATGV